MDLVLIGEAGLLDYIIVPFSIIFLLGCIALTLGLWLQERRPAKG